MGLTEWIAQHATAFIDSTGYLSVLIMMIGESMILPIPSEAVMPFAGFLIVSGRFTFTGVILVSLAGSIIGSSIGYAMGRFGGEPFLLRFGKYFLLDEEDLQITRRFFSRFGEPAIFICRFIPVVRHLISIPAGIGRMNFYRFIIFTSIGAAIWNGFLTWIGFIMKQNWHIVMKYSHTIDVVVVCFLALLLFLYIYRHVARKKKAA